MSRIVKCPLCKNKEMIKENSSFWDWREEGGFWQLGVFLIKFYVFFGIGYLIFQNLGIKIVEI